MILSILRFTYVACDLITIGAGAVVLFGLLTGELVDEWTTLFLRYTLATSVTGLLFPFHSFTLVQSCSMLSVYVTGMSVLAWRTFHLSGVWRSIFALTITIVLYLNVVVAIDQAFVQLSRFTTLATTQSELTFRATQFIFLELFLVIGIVAVRRFQARPAHSVRSHTIGADDKHVL
jgi:hypothetical protein